MAQHGTCLVTVMVTVAPHQRLIPHSGLTCVSRQADNDTDALAQQTATPHKLLCVALAAIHSNHRAAVSPPRPLQPHQACPHHPQHQLLLLPWPHPCCCLLRPHHPHRHRHHPLAQTDVRGSGQAGAEQSTTQTTHMHTCECIWTGKLRSECPCHRQQVIARLLATRKHKHKHLRQQATPLSPARAPGPPSSAPMPDTLLIMPPPLPPPPLPP